MNSQVNYFMVVASMSFKNIRRAVCLTAGDFQTDCRSGVGNSASGSSTANHRTELTAAGCTRFSASLRRSSEIFSRKSADGRHS